MTQFYKGMSKHCGNNLFKFDHTYILTAKRMTISETLAIKVSEIC